jgi:AcrR family transcriptional regulator
MTTDPLDLLRLEPTPVMPRNEFADQLEDRVRQALAPPTDPLRPERSTMPTATSAPDADVMVPATSPGRPHLITEDSLSRTLDAVEELAFEDRTLSSAERKRVAQWIAGRQGLPRAKSGTFAGFPPELRDGVVVFTGERFTHASARHILGEEACRVLRWLDVRDPNVQAALERADAGLMSAVAGAEHDPRYGNNPGAYCCTKCSVGMWRNLTSGGLDRREERLRKGVGQFLRSNRTGQGRWRAFPFWYTVLALTEVDVPEARDEIEYAAPVLERTARRGAPSDTYAKRRHELALRALSLL